MSARNQDCPCGSGKKFKNCCGSRAAEKSAGFPVAAKVGLVAFAVIAGWVLIGSVRRAASTPAAGAPAGQVWSEEHGHYHPASGGSNVAQPHEAPPGKVWSEEHGHFHDEIDPNVQRPDGPTPPGKVWSAEHGHWHDEGYQAPHAPEGPPPPGKVWSAEHGHWHDAANPDAGHGGEDGKVWSEEHGHWHEAEPAPLPDLPESDVSGSN